jgi:hypothetical protein
MNAKFLWKNLKEWDEMEDLSVCGNIILKLLY